MSACTETARYIVTDCDNDDDTDRVCEGHLADSIRAHLEYGAGPVASGPLNAAAGFPCEWGEDGCE